MTMPAGSKLEADHGFITAYKAKISFVSDDGTIQLGSGVAAASIARWRDHSWRIVIIQHMRKGDLVEEAALAEGQLSFKLCEGYEYSGKAQIEDVKVIVSIDKENQDRLLGFNSSKNISSGIAAIEYSITSTSLERK